MSVNCWLRSGPATLLGLLLLAVAAQPARAQGKSSGTYLTEAVVRVTGNADLVNRARGYGYAEGISLLGAWVDAGANVGWHDVPMTAGTEYLFIAGGDNDAEDVDLAVLDRDGRVLIEDVGTAAEAWVHFTPRATGKYTLRLTLYKARQNVPCVCVATLLRKGGFDVPLATLDQVTRKMTTELANADRDIQQRLNKRIDLRRARGEWAIFGGVLNQGETTSVINMNLGNGLRAFFGAGDNASRDVDLFLLDANNGVVKEDVRTHPEAVLIHTPGPGLHGLRIRNYQSRGPSLVMMGVFDLR